MNKKRLTALVNEHDLLPKKEVEKEKSKDAKYDRLKTIKQNPRKVTLEDVETGEIKTFPLVYKVAQFIDLLGREGGRELGIINTRSLSNNFIMFYVKT